MELMDLLKQRYSLRQFSPKKVEREKIDAVLAAARLAPTAVNYQPQKIYVLQSEDARRKLKGCTNYSFDAPLAFLVCYDKNESWKRSYDGEDGGPADACITTTQMMLMLVTLGLGSTWVGSFDPAAVSEAYGLAENIVPYAILPAGYPAEGAQPSPKHDIRRPVEEIARFL
ncbi:MAG TPA: nitroreductase [Clostridiales bacterium]|nr:nitroreductase [Clostridiales bacterium]